MVNKQDVVKNINSQCQWQLHDLVILLSKERDIPMDTRVDAKVTLLDINWCGAMTLECLGQTYSCDGCVDSANKMLLQMNDPTKLYDIFHETHRHVTNKNNMAPWSIDKVIGPNSLVDWLIILGVCLPSLCYFYRPVLYILFAWDTHSKTVLHWLDNDKVLLAIIILEFFTHAMETWRFLIPQLKFHRVHPAIWPQWLFWGLLEGYGPVRRLKSYTATLSIPPLVVIKEDSSDI